MAQRELTIGMRTESGMINRFYAFVDGTRVIAADGNEEAEETVTVGAKTRLKVRVWGVGHARYKLSIDLPGTAQDQALVLALEEGYHELELEI